jgi:hypothetical protein
MMKNTINQSRLQLKTWGRSVAIIDEAVETGNIRPLLDFAIKQSAAEVGKPYGYAYAEAYRVERFGGLEGWFQQESVALNAGEPMFTRSFFK